MTYIHFKSKQKKNVFNWNESEFKLNKYYIKN